MRNDRRHVLRARRWPDWRESARSPRPAWLALMGMALSCWSESIAYSGARTLMRYCNADFRIQPVGRLHLAAAAQAEQNGIGHVLLGQAHFGGLDAVHGNVELRPVVRLLHAHVHRAGNLFDFIGEPRGDGAVVGLVAADHLHVERRGQAEVQGLADNVRGQEIKHGARELAVQSRAQAAHVIFRGRVAGFERDEHVRVGRPDDAAGVVAQIDAGIRDADVVDDAANFTRRNFAADGLVDLRQ